MKKNYTMYPIKNVHAVLLISANVELCLRISTSGEGFQNLLRSKCSSNRTAFDNM